MQRRASLTGALIVMNKNATPFRPAGKAALARTPAPG